MADKAEINPNVLKWARETARMSEETAAAKVNVAVEKLQEWESGSKFPTIRQAQTLAKAYKRPFALLFLAEPPRDFQPQRDFRTKGAKPLGTGSVFIIREIQEKQAWISDVNKEDKEPKAEFVGRYSILDNPLVVAEDILRTFRIEPGNYQTTPMREWIDKAESAGIFVSRTSFIHSHLTLDADEFQGFAIADPYAPFVFINSDDYDAPQLFTLVHEISHLWIAATGISNHVEPTLDALEGLDPVELFCNEVAANALIPGDVLNALPLNTFASGEQLYRQSRRFGISSYAFLVRAFKAKRISLSEYRQLKSVADSEFQAYVMREEEKKAKQKSSTGGPNYYLIQVNRNSRLFTETVLVAYGEGYIAPTQASSLLNVKVNKFPKLEEQLYK